jgi:PAS domain S-box-containing protein
MSKKSQKTTKKDEKAFYQTAAVSYDLLYLLDEEFHIVDHTIAEEIQKTVKTETNILIGQDFFLHFQCSDKKEVVRESLEKNNRWKGTAIFEGNTEKEYFVFLSNHPVYEERLLAQCFLLPDVETQRGAAGYDITNFQELFNTINSFIYIIGKSPGGEEVFYSSSIRNVTGYSPAEIKNFNGKLLYITHKDDVSRILKTYSEFVTMSKERSIELAYRIITRDNEERWVKENIYVLFDRGKNVRKLFGIVTDITENRKNEEELQEKLEELEKINYAKDRFINILSHDLRAPFTSILGFAEILLNEKNLGEKEREEYLTYIYDASSSQLQFVNYLLDWSRLRTGSMKPETRRINVQPLLYNCISALTGNAIRKNIEIITNIDDDLYVQGDERLLTQAIINLLNNAIKFSHENSDIEVSAAIFNEKQIEFIVKDSGIGIDVADQAKLFSIDKALTKEGTKGEKGTGFGLNLVKEIVDKHGGRIWFYSEPDKGAEFHITIPTPSNSCLIVMADDEERKKLSKLIRLAFPQYDILSSGNGYEALELVSKNLPHFIITNHDLPLMDGVQLIESLKPADGNEFLPAFIVADKLPQRFLEHYKQLGVKDFLKSTMTDEEIIQVIKETLQ